MDLCRTRPCTWSEACPNGNSGSRSDQCPVRRVLLAVRSDVDVPLVTRARHDAAAAASTQAKDPRGNPAGLSHVLLMDHLPAWWSTRRCFHSHGLHLRLLRCHCRGVAVGTKKNFESSLKIQ